MACTVLSVPCSEKMPQTQGKAGSSRREPRFDFERQLVQRVFIYDEGFVKQVLSDLEKKKEILVFSFFQNIGSCIFGVELDTIQYILLTFKILHN